MADEADADDGPEDKYVAPAARRDSNRRSASVGWPFGVEQSDAVRRLVREEIGRAWNEVGVDFEKPDKRLEHLLLIQWIRERKLQRETGMNKVYVGLIGGLVTALMTGLTALAATFLGKHG